MATIALTTETFQETIQRDGIVLVDWWAAWCGPCRAFAPTFEKASERHPDLTFAKIDTQAEPDAAEAGRRLAAALDTLRAGTTTDTRP